MPLFVKIYISDLFVLHNYFNINSLGSLSSHFTSGNKLSLNTTTVVFLSLNPHVYLRLNGLVEYINNFPLSSLAIHIVYYKLFLKNPFSINSHIIITIRDAGLRIIRKRAHNKSPIVHLSFHLILIRMAETIITLNMQYIIAHVIVTPPTRF